MSKCPYCTAPFNAAVVAQGSGNIQSGDVAVCAQCLEPAVFVVTAFGVTARRATLAEAERHKSSPDYADAVALAAAYRRP